MGNRLNPELKEKQSFLMRKSLWEIEGAINNISDREERMLLQLRYVDRYSFDYISLRMHISRATAFRIHARALLHLVIPDDHLTKCPYCGSEIGGDSHE